jgi:serine/threonine-protein kinase HipA
MRTAKVYINAIVAGTLTENDDGTFIFRYDDDYFFDPACSSVSLTLPKNRQEYRSATLFPFFSNMLSEGVNRRVQARLFKLDEEDSFGLLLAAAGGDVIGAVTVKRI